jgi:thiol-disulfide isomerase/thioredoxin
MRAIVRYPAIALLLVAISAHGTPGESLAPELTHSAASEWINSPPQSLAALRGQPVLIEFWTFDCINCRRTLPWLKAVQQRYAKDGLAIISVHTPELEHEKNPTNVRQAVTRLGISYPVMLDHDFSYWSALRNQYWPAFYLIDSRGRIVAEQIGELHEGQARGDDFERQIKRALARP